MRRKMPKRIQPYGTAWQNMANELARSYAPTIYPCVHCGAPVASGYCCMRCGSADPSNPDSTSYIPKERT